MSADQPPLAIRLDVVCRALGPLWFGIPCIALLWVGADPATGWRTIFWIFAVVWATDIGAYAVGRTVGAL